MNWKVFLLIAVLVVGVGVYLGKQKETTPLTSPEEVKEAKQVEPTPAPPQEQAQEQEPEQKTAQDSVGETKDSEKPGQPGVATKPDQKLDEKKNEEARKKESSTSPVAGLSKKTEPKKVEHKYRVCKKVEFRHKTIDSHEDGEACLRHKNRIPMPQVGFVKETACLKVNGRVVRLNFIQNKKEIEFSPGPGPQAKVEFEYCDSGKTPLNPCVYKKSGVLSSFGIDDAKIDDGKSLGWGGKGERQELKNEVDEFRKIASEIEGVDMDLVFRGWVVKNEEEIRK